MGKFQSFILVLTLLIGGGISLSAQDRQVSGKVLDADELPVIGAAVMVEGTTVGSMTSDDGSFTLSVPDGDVTLVVSCLGYMEQKVNLPASRSAIDIYLQEDNLMLDETVVVGYGVQKKVNLTGAVATVSNKQLENRVAHSVTNMLQGSVAGLNITTSSGDPSATPTINIRGTASINSTSPLVLIDGAVGELDRVNPNDVESISVIKDASAAAVYGFSAPVMPRRKKSVCSSNILRAHSAVRKCSGGTAPPKTVCRRSSAALRTALHATASASPSPSSSSASTRRCGGSHGSSSSQGAALIPYTSAQAGTLVMPPA